MARTLEELIRDGLAQTAYPNPDLCWLWPFTQKGYGAIDVVLGYDYSKRNISNGQFRGHRAIVERHKAHRATWAHIKGERVPDHMVLDHLCGNRACVNPAHLDMVTLIENSRRGNKHAALGLNMNAAPQPKAWTLFNDLGEDANMMAADRESLRPIMTVDLDALPTRRCDQCVYSNEDLVKLDIGRGKPMYKPVCQVCGRRGNAIAHDKVARLGVDIAALPVIYNRNCRCARGCIECRPACEWPDCRTHEMIERHHFFPCKIYGDEFAERGPTAYYCQTHHDGWHQKVTPQIRQRDAA
jgi:hypothetical protein